MFNVHSTTIPSETYKFKILTNAKKKLKALIWNILKNVYKVDFKKPWNALMNYQQDLWPCKEVVESHFHPGFSIIHHCGKLKPSRKIL